MTTTVQQSWNVLPANSKQRLSQRLTEIAPDGSAINEDTQVLFFRSLKVSVFTKATFSQTLQKVHALSGPVQNTLYIDSQGTVVWDLKIKESDMGKRFHQEWLWSYISFCLLKSTLTVVTSCAIHFTDTNIKKPCPPTYCISFWITFLEIFSC